ncbi:12937_t:CDS:2, partial [Cetraspora pellucida]
MSVIVDQSVSENELQEYSETNETNESSQLFTKHRNVSSKEQGDIWLYVNKGVSLGRGHYKASCCGLKRTVLDKIYETAALIWNNLHYSEESCIQLLVEMRSWKRKDEPYHLSYNSTHETPIKWWCSVYVDDDQDQLQQLALHLFSIVPSQAVCERNFSMLKWFYGNKRTQLCLSRVEDITKICSYYLLNSDKELQLYGKDLNNKELYESINTSMITYDLLETSDENTNNGRTSDLEDINGSEDLENLTLNIADSVDLALPEFLASGDAVFSSEPVTTNRARNVGNMNYNPIELARQM